ncbi:MAG: hypothetical protein ACLQPH_17510 [Acidimicrobiales bacterium]
MTVSAARVRWFLSVRGKIKRAPRPLVPLDETEVRLELDRTFTRLRDGR